MKVLITGSDGQLGQELQNTIPKEVELFVRDVDSMDITDIDSIHSTFTQVDPDVVINAAAYTAVDKAESEQEAAYEVNADGPRNIARVCKVINRRLIHVSTDFIFSGNSPLPYLPGDQPGPLSVYGKSKLKGELAVNHEMNGEVLIFRTAWLYSAHGNNFVKSMLRLMKEKDKIRVVYDQVGSPTWARTLAKTMWHAALKHPELKGIYHWTDTGTASWYDFAVAIQSEALALGILDKKIPIFPIRTNQFPTPATRPANSVLDCSETWTDFSVTPVHWRIILKDMLYELAFDK